VHVTDDFDWFSALYLNPCRYNKDFFNATRSASVAASTMIGPKLLKDVGGKSPAAGASSTYLSFDVTTGKHIAVTSSKASPIKLTEFFAPTSTKGISIPKRVLDTDAGAGASGAGAGAGGEGAGSATTKRGLDSNGGAGAGGSGAGSATTASSPASKKARGGGLSG
jgi:hypothetical protein